MLGIFISFETTKSLCSLKECYVQLTSNCETEFEKCDGMKLNSHRFKGKVVLVTGSGSGIGKAIALSFAKESADLVVNDIDFELACEVAAEIEKIGCRSVPIKADVSDFAQVQKMVRHTLGDFQRIDVLVNNACVGSIGLPVEEIDAQQWNVAIGTCLNGTFFCSQAVGKGMIKRKSGKIINISSLGGLAAAPFAAEYTSAKHGVIGLTKALAVEWSRYNVNVNCICPGVVDTSMFRAYARKFPDLARDRIRAIPKGKIATPEDVAKAAKFLASNEADYLAGAILCVDGGSFALLSGYFL